MQPGSSMTRFGPALGGGGPKRKGGKGEYPSSSIVSSPVPGVNVRQMIALTRLIRAFARQIRPLDNILADDILLASVRAQVRALVGDGGR